MSKELTRVILWEVEGAIYSQHENPHPDDQTKENEVEFISTEEVAGLLEGLAGKYDHQADASGVIVRTSDANSPRNFRYRVARQAQREFAANLKSLASDIRGGGE